MAPRPGSGLTRERVLDAALDLADAEGLAALSMRRLAARLGVEAMSLYNHVTCKADLLDGVASRIFEAVALPDSALPWDDRLRALGASCYLAFRAHPAVVRAIAAGQADPRSAGALRILDAILGALLDAGLDTRGAVRGYRVLLGIVFGSVLLESADTGGDDAARSEPVVDWFRRMVTEDQLPHLYRSLPALIDADCGQDFEHELDLLIRGLRESRSGQGLQG
jgi:TetR/AcrR family transcriptional regulator, tetracycline repressor protein